MIKEPQGNSEIKKTVAVNDRLLGIFARDAVNTVDTVSSIMSITGSLSEEDLRKYTISVHGIKSALAYIGQMELSAEALKLEMAGRSNDTDLIYAETAGFLESLQTLIDEINLKQQQNTTSVDSEDKGLLKQQFEVIKNAAEEYDEGSVSNALTALREKKWSSETNKVLEEIAACLLHSDFDRIVEIVSSF